MKKLFLAMVLCLVATTNSRAEIGVNVGLGLPFVQQFGLNMTMGPNWSANLGYNKLSLSTGEATADLTMPEVMMNWHPFGGAFFMGLGLGQETLVSEASDSDTGVTAKGEVTAMTTIAKLGWMWGKANGGFWFGMDLAFISPSGAEEEFSTTGGTPSAESEKDVRDSLKTFGETAFTNITFARFGYLF